MAKKTAAKKSASKKSASAKPVNKKPAPAKSAAKKSTPKKAAPKAKGGGSAGLAPFSVKTGPGLSPVEIGSKLVADFNAGKAEITDELWSKDITSIEGLGVNLGWKGRKAVDEKNNQWSATHKIHGASAEGPYVGSTGFAVKFKMDVEDTSNGQRIIMEEVGVYTVKNGKIITEEFMYFAG